MIMTNEFRIRTVDALSDATIRENFRGAMDFLRDKRSSVFQGTDLASLREQGAAIRKHVIGNMAELLEELEKNCLRNGMHVHWAEDAKQARTIIADIAHANDVKRVVKGKSMASEEIELNEHLESLDIECLETDMGEFIVQLDHEPPSHIIMPAIHKSKDQIAELFERELGEDTKQASVDDLIGIGRKALRGKFEHADMGVSGVNFAIADSGALCLVENEGNGRMCTSVPKVHVALMGIEKVLPSFNELPTLMSLLTGSATGQIITTYLNIISSPQKSGEFDGPEQMHLVLLDNGRSAMHADDVMQETLACIRCGACMNHCPVYTRIGGHAYGSTYPGPIGQVVTPQIESMESKGDLLDACSLNGACGEACPVNIELPKLIRALRSKQIEQKGLQRIVWKLWRATYLNRATHFLLSSMLKTLGRLPLPRPKAWTSTRAFPKLAIRSFSDRMKERQNEH